MIHLQIYEDFLDDKMKKMDDTNNQDLKNDFSTFNSRKDNLKNLILNNVNTDKDISNNINQIVEDNKYLKMYLDILMIHRNVLKYTEKIKIYNQQIVDKNQQITNIGKENLNDDNKIDLIKDLKEQVDECNRKIKETKDKGILLEKDIQKKEAELNNVVKDAEKKIKGL